MAVELRNLQTGGKILIMNVWCQDVENPQRVYVADRGFPLQSEKAGRLVLSTVRKSSPFDPKDKRAFRSLVPAEGYEIIGNVWV